MAYLTIAIIVGVLLLRIILYAISRLKRSTIYEFQAGLLYEKGAFKKVMGTGSYHLNKNTQNIFVFDLRTKQLYAAAQEVPTQDNVNIKASLLLEYRIADAFLMHKSLADDVNNYLHHALQLALREITVRYTLEGLLEKRAEAAEQLQEALKIKLAMIGLAVEALHIKDIILPPNLKRAYNAMVEVQKEALVKLEVARGEQAVLRNLANAAKMLDQNPNLLNLRLLQSLQKEDRVKLALSLQPKVAEK